MDLLKSNCCFTLKSCNLHLLLSTSQFSGGDTHICYGNTSSSKFSTKLFCGYGGHTSALASQNQTKKLRKRASFQKIDKKSLSIPDKNDGVDRPSPSVDVEDGNKNSSLEVQTSVLAPTRSDVLQACTVTCGLIGALGVLIRQVFIVIENQDQYICYRPFLNVSHIAAREGLPVADCSADITFGLESWHLGLIMGSVILVSSSRFLLLKIWPDFAESSEAANQQVLTSLEPLDYLIVAFLPGISEELLFRGSLLPLFGINWTSIFAVAALFGVLHLGNGRNYSFAIWATLVGVVYGYATVSSSSIMVPMAAHALNNLVGGIIWRYSSKQTR